MATIQIVVDNPLRDLTCDVLLTGHLLAHNHKVVLTPFDNAPYETFRLAPDYLLVNYVRKNNEHFLKRLTETGIQFGVLDTEGGVFVKMEDEGGKPNFVKTFSDNQTVIKGMVDYFVWGRNIYDFLKKEGPFPPEALRLTGTPRTDVFHPKWTGENPPKDLILVNTSFTLANPKYRSAEAEAEALVSDFGFNEKKVFEALKNQRSFVEIFLQAVEEMAKTFNNETFVVRPHPFEGASLYQTRFRSFGNIEVNSQKTVDFWLRRSKALFHFECSTALEAALLGIPTFSLGGYSHLRPIESVASVTRYCESTDDLLLKFEQVLQGTYQPEASLAVNTAKVTESVYYQFDGRASERISNIIFEKLNVEKTHKKALIYFWRAFYLLRNLVKMLTRKSTVKISKRFNAQQCRDLVSYFSQTQLNLFEKAEVVQSGDSVIFTLKHQ